MPLPQNRAISDTFFSQLFLFIDNRRKIKSRRTRFVGRPPLSRLRRRFGPLRGTQRRCAALCAAPPGRYAPRALRAQPFLEHEKKAIIYTSEIIGCICFSPQSSSEKKTGVNNARHIQVFENKTYV